MQLVGCTWAGLAHSSRHSQTGRGVRPPIHGLTRACSRPHAPAAPAKADMGPIATAAVCCWRQPAPAATCMCGACLALEGHESGPKHRPPRHRPAPQSRAACTLSHWLQLAAAKGAGGSLGQSHFCACIAHSVRECACMPHATHVRSCHPLAIHLVAPISTLFYAPPPP